MKKILFSMFYSILVGEEPDSVLLKKRRGNLTISEGTVATSLFNFHSRVLCISTPFLKPQNEMDKLLFLGTHTRFVTTKG
uniref:Uncharacterized protein n=1 Tax=Spirodela intermedia TaxID=51605 RepID=A0A8S0XWG2_SPIIN